MPYARRSPCLELINRPLHAVTLPLDEIGADEEPRPIEPVMTVHTEQPWIVGGRSRSQAIDEADEVFDLGGGRRDFGDGGEFVVLDTAVVEAFGVVDRTFVADVDDRLDLVAPVLDEDGGGVRFVDFSQGLHGAEDAGDGLRHGFDRLPLHEVLDVPFAFGGEML